MGFDPWEQDTKDIKRLQKRLCHSGSTFSKIWFLKRASWSNWGLGLRGPFEISKCPVDRGQALRCIPAEVQEFHGISIFASVSLWGGKHLLLDHVWNTSIRRELPKVLQHCENKNCKQLSFVRTKLIVSSFILQAWLVSRIWGKVKSSQWHGRGKYWKETSPFQKQAFKHALMHYSIRVGES